MCLLAEPGGCRPVTSAPQEAEARQLQVQGLSGHVRAGEVGELAKSTHPQSPVQAKGADLPSVSLGWFLVLR